MMLMAPNNLVLREATTGELPAALAVLHAAFEEYRTQLNPPSSAHRETIASLQARLESGHLLLALIDGDIVGCVIYQVEPDYMYLGRLAVLPAHRRRGIGTALIAYIEDYARAIAAPRVRLGVRIALAHVRNRYERMGYRLVEERSHPGFATPTYVFLEKEL